MHWIVVCCVLMLFPSCIDAQDSPIMAYFNMSEVIGDIVFSEMDNTGNNTKATINIKVDNIWFNWEIREFPVLLSEADPCSEDKLGRRVVNLSPFKNIIDSRTTAGTEVELNGVSLLQGDNAILGRSVLLYNDNKRACATIQGSEILLHASIEGHVAGKVEVRRVGTRYAIFSNLFNTKSLASSTTTLRIYRGSILPDEAAAQKQEVVLDDRCDIVSGASLVAEVKNVPIAGGADTSLHFSHVLATVARVDYSNWESEEIWAKVDIETGYSCGNFHIYERKEVQATFSVNGVTGFMRFSQDNPYTPTNVTVELTKLDNNGGGYHIHEYPLPYQFEAITDQCGSGSTGGHFNPFGATGYNPSQNSQATQELYEIGDLSAKHGFLTSADDWSQNYTDMFIPLFGKNSVVGRSIVIHYPDGNRFICATIGYPGPVTVAQAEFNGEAFGTITFVQEENKPWSDTTVLVEVVSAQESESLQHNWHIHRDPVGDDYLPGSDARCSSTGPHWNPFAAPIADTNVYEPTCGAHRQGCEVGDLSAKYQEKINLASTRENPEKLFYSDILPLTGGYTIINRAITIHYPNGGAPRFVCGDIKKKLTPAVTTESIWWGPSEDDTVTGAIKIASDGLPKAVATLEVDLDGLAEMAGGYHIHMYPLNSRNPGDNVCGTTGGHYNPFGVTEWENDDSFDKYEIGDLSSKFGTLNDESTFKGQFFDTNLPLSGANSVVGRSVVIHQSADGSRWKCSNTVWDTEAMNATLVEAKADFVGAVTGYMKFSQMMTPEGESNVNIEVMLSHTDAAALGSVEHNWHVHESSVNYGDCKTAGGHYNPFKIDVSASSYQSQCDESTPRKCEMGDEAGKLGRIEIGANGEQSRYVFNDDYLSLNGKFPIIGRSIVIHAANEGGDRIACADIIPYGVSTFAVEYYIETPNDAFKDSMATNIENSLFMDDLNHVYVKDGDVKGSCTAVSVMFTGPDAEQLKNNFTRDFYDYATESYKVKDINACSSAMGNAAMLSGVTLLISIMAALLLH